MQFMISSATPRMFRIYQQCFTLDHGDATLALVNLRTLSLLLTQYLLYPTLFALILGSAYVIKSKPRLRIMFILCFKKFYTRTFKQPAKQIASHDSSKFLLSLNKVYITLNIGVPSVK